MEPVERIYCCDRDNNDNTLTAAILANGNNRRDDWGPMAAMMSGGMNNWMNNPFAYIMFLALFRNGGFGFNGDGTGAATQGIETQAQLNAIRTQLQDNQNADCIKSAIQGNGFAISQLSQMLNIDFNTLQKCCCDIQAAIQQVAGQVNFSAERVINAVNLGVIATSFKLYRIAAAKLNARLQISVLICYFRTVKTHLRFAMANAILVLQLHKVSQLLLSRLSKISAIFFVPVKTTLSASLIL